MDVDEPGLFEMPDREPVATSERPLRGRNRETWARTVTAEVAIIDAEALHEAALRVEENALTIGLHADLNVQETVAEADVEAAADAFAELAWLIWPTDGLEGPVAAGAFQILSVDSEAVAESDDRGILTWTVVVKLTDVHELRRLAAQAHPEEAGLIADSLAVAWQRAADPFAPVRSIPGTAWRPGQVEVHHVARRARQGSAGPT
jgi:hypothetical protein